jgi:DNA repair protein RecN (Recombination protein N)
LLTSLKLKEQENRKEKDYLSFLWTELDEAQLEKLNFEDLKLRFLKIENGEKIRHSLEFAKAVFDHEHQAPIVGIKRLIDTFDELTKFGGNFNEISTRLHSIKIELEDLEQEITNLEEEDYSSSEEIEFVREKIEKINALLFKHNLTDEKQLIELKSTLSTKLADIVNSEDLIEKISSELQVSKKEILQKAAEISEKRKAVKSHLEKEVHRRLTNLGMPNAALEIQLNPKEKPSETGMDEIEFLAKTNLGGQFSPLKKVASGGELSRLMLAIMSILSEKKNLPTLLFDEIDTGVSGEIANKIALEFDSMGKQIQVIAITHLPQVAAKGKTHLHVSKESSNEKTITFVKELIESQRIDVLASMISGEEITEAAKKNALHLLTNN